MKQEVLEMGIVEVAFREFQRTKRLIFARDTIHDGRFLGQEHRNLVSVLAWRSDQLRTFILTIEIGAGIRNDRWATLYF